MAAKTTLTPSLSILRMSQRFGDPFAYHAVLPGALEYFVLAYEVAHHHQQVVAPPVAQGRLVVWDRVPYCPEACAATSGADLTWIRAALDLVPAPDLVALLDLDPLTAYRRLRGRARTPVQRVGGPTGPGAGRLPAAGPGPAARGGGGRRGRRRRAHSAAARARHRGLDRAASGQRKCRVSPSAKGTGR